ncbi:MAG TPA: phosphotransferase, partial [Chloroflexota bacterium]
IGEVSIVDSVPLEGAQVKFAEVRYREGDPETYALPLCRAADGTVIDALRENEFNAALLDAIGRRRRFRGRVGVLQGARTSYFNRLRGSGDLTPHISGAEQSNNSVIFGERMILKLFRRVEEGINPDLEVSHFLTEHGFPNVAPVTGALLYRRGRGEQNSALAMLQGYVPNQGDGWSQALDELARGDRGAIQHYESYAALLGRRTAEMHITLASDSEDPAFAPEPTTMLSTRSVYQSIRGLGLQVIRQLRRQLNSLPQDARVEAERVLELEPHLLPRLRSLLDRPIAARRIRTHGDYHLGQVLFTGGDYVIVDFEGEPLRPLAERRLKRWAAKDVAGMLRSFTYAAETAKVDFGEEWADRASRAFLTAYWAAAEGAPFASPTLAERELLLDAMLIEKALYETRYELDNRPPWVRIPLRGLVRLLT